MTWQQTYNRLRKHWMESFKVGGRTVVRASSVDFFRRVRAGEVEPILLPWGAVKSLYR